MLSIISRVESWCSASNRTRRLSVAGRRDGSAADFLLDPVDAAEHDESGIERDREHAVTMIVPDEEVGRPRAEHGHGGERRAAARAGGVGDVVKPRERDAEQLAGQRAPGDRLAGLQHLERRRGDDRAEHDHAAQPDDQGEHVDVPQREHHAIIVRIPTPKLRSHDESGRSRSCGVGIIVGLGVRCDGDSRREFGSRARRWSDWAVASWTRSSSWEFN